MVVMLFLICILLMSLKIVYETLLSYYLIPKRITKIMEKQGVRGPKPRFLVGNILDMASLVSESTSNDMDSIHHDIVARLLPHYVAWSKIYGNNFQFVFKKNDMFCSSLTIWFIKLINRETIHFLERDRTENVLIRSRFNQRAFFKVQQCFWKILATTARF